MGRIQEILAADGARGQHGPGAALLPGGLRVWSLGHPTIQRLDIYGRAARGASALPPATAATFRRQVEAGNQAMALSVVVAAMTGRGELDTRLLRTSGEGDLWQIRAVGDLTAQAAFRPAFPDPDHPSRRLPNPRRGS